jgi:hypothetical protein
VITGRPAVFRFGSLCVAAVVAIAAYLGLASPAHAAGQTPGTYTNYSFPSGTSALSEVTFGTTVDAYACNGGINQQWSAPS